MTNPDALDLPTLPPPLGSWADHAACKGLPVAIFFPERGEPNQLAKQTCAGCPVADQCATYAVPLGNTLKGTWGGLSERQRQQVRRGEPPTEVNRPGRQRQECPHGTFNGYKWHKRHGVPIPADDACGCRAAYAQAAAAARRVRDEVAA